MASSKPLRFWFRPRALGVFLLLLLVWPSAASSAEPPKPADPTGVEVGVWFSSLHSFNVPDGSFGAEFYIWWISRDPDFRPFQALQILNGRGWTAKSVRQRKLPDGTYHTSGFISVTVNHSWELLYFPYDRQSLRIIIETSSTASELRLAPNQKSSTVSDFMKVAGFKLVDLNLRERVEQYRTNFGIPGASGNKFSRLVISIDLKRESGRLVIALLIGFIVANVVCLLTYAINITNIAIRVALGGGAIFAAVGNMYLLNTALNPAVGSLLVDRFAVGTFTAIVAALLTAIVVERLERLGKPHLALVINRSVFGVVLVGSLIFFALSFHAATHGPS